MALNSFSRLIYGFEITTSNQNLNFSEGGGELTAQLTPGTYPMSQMTTVLKTALDSAGANEYFVSLNRSSRVFTISSPGNNFELLVSSGSQIGTSPFSLLGFNQTSDLTGTDTYSGNSAAGDVYEPQFKLQDYVDPEMFIERVDPTNNESASGNIESVGFGFRSFIVMSFKFITDLTMDNKVIKNNPTGKADFERFMQFAIKKGPFEFEPNIDDSNTFFVTILESTPSNGKGTGYRLTELVRLNLPGIYELNNVKLRVVE